METIYSPDQVAMILQRDLTERLHLSVAEASRRIGKKPQTLYNVLRGKNRISYPIAKLLQDTFGYSLEFLTTGEGSLRENDDYYWRGADGKQRVPGLSPVDDVMWAHFYYPEHRVNTPRERLLLRYCQLFYEIVSSLTIHGDLEIDDKQLEDPRIREYNFCPRTMVERELFSNLALYLTQISQLTDLHRIVERLDVIKEDED